MNSMKMNTTLLPMISRRSLPILRSSHRLLSEKKVESTETPTETPSYEKPRYATRMSYESSIKSSRIGREADASSGVQPTTSQKWFLIITGLFRNRKEIPQYVPNQTMQRMHDRMRIVFIVTATTLFFTIFYIMEHRTSRKIERDRAAGVQVTRMV